MTGNFHEIFLSGESECNKLTSSNFNEQLTFFDKSLTFFLDLIQSAKTERKDTLQEGSILLLNLRIFTSLFCASNLIKSGYYHEAAIIQRNVQESLYLCKYLDKNPDSAKTWIKGKIERSEITGDLNLPKGTKELYNDLSGHVHPNLASILDVLTYEKRDDNSQKYAAGAHLGSIFNFDTAYTSIIIQLLLVQMAIDNFSTFFKSHNWIEDTETLQRCHDALHEKYFKIFGSWVEYTNRE
jgi:hypothetical protein